MENYLPTCTKVAILNKTAKDSSNDAYAMFLYVCVFSFYLIFFIKAYVVGTHLNCIDKSMQFKWVPTTCFYKEKDIKYTGCKRKTTKLLECALIGVCAVIR